MPYPACVIESAWKPGEPVSLFGRRVEVRTARLEDLPDYERWAREESVAQFVWAPPGDVAGVVRRTFDSNDNHTRFVLSVWHRRDRRLIGYVRLACDFERGVMIPTVTLGDAHYRGGHMAHEAAGLVYDFAFAQFSLQAIERHVYADNERVLQALRASVSMRESEHHDENGRAVRTFVTTREEWQREASALFERLGKLPDAPPHALTTPEWTPGQRLEISTERLLLRSLHESDVNDGLVAWTQSGAVARRFRLPSGERKHVLSEVARRADDDRFFCLLVRERTTGKTRGLVRLNRYPDPKNLTVSLALEARAEVPPLGADVLLALGDFFFSRELIETLELRVDADDAILVRRAKELGFPLRDVEKTQRSGLADVCVFVATHYQWLGIAERMRERQRLLTTRAAARH